MVRPADLSRGMLLIFAVVYPVLLVAGRTLLLWLQRWLAVRRGQWTRAAIIGQGALAERLADRLKEVSYLPFELAGFVSVGPTGDGQAGTRSEPVLGQVSDLRQILWQHKIEQVFVALPLSDMHRLGDILTVLGREHVAAHFVPDVIEKQWLSSHISQLVDLPIVHLSETPTVGWPAVVKRIEDLVVASVLLVVCAPVMLAIAVAIRLTSPGPVLFRQERVGQNGRRFGMLKFRTMRVCHEPETEVFTRTDNPRITRVGHFLRRHMLDELPQFFNVLRGEMSVVGPRPERPWAVEQVREGVRRYMLKHKVKAGITGWAQVNGYRGSGSLEKRIHYDLFYIRRWSLWFDLRIILMTAREVIFGNRHRLRRTARRSLQQDLARTQPAVGHSGSE
jgi:Undecaprenyl-phosphate glucose phosphotransferase